MGDAASFIAPALLVAYVAAGNGEIGAPCGMPRRLSRASVVRFFRPRSSVSSTGHSSHILIRWSTRRSTIETGEQDPA